MTTTTTTAAISGDRRRVCFSFAAYAKAVIEHLRSRGVPVAIGLSDPELAAIESEYGFEFPPDLRSILVEGLPIGAGFPNWRDSSPQQLQILVSLPVSGLVHHYAGSAEVRAAMERAPVLVPIYRRFYIPAIKGIAGNPVFHVSGGEVSVGGFDIADYFRRGEWGVEAAAAWGAKAARRVEVWSDLMEGNTWTNGWAPRGGVEARLREMGWRLREGGWGEADVREMLMDGGDGTEEGNRMVLMDRKSVMWHVRLLALALLKAGWSAEDVVDSMGCTSEEETWQVGPGPNEISMEL